MSFVDTLIQDIASFTPYSVLLMGLAGLLVGVAPGSYPLLAVGAGFSAGTGGGGGASVRWRAVYLATGFVLGVALVDAVLGALFGLLGFAVMRVLAPLMVPVYFALSLGLVVIGLALLGVLQINLRILYAAPRKVDGFFAALLLGVPFGLSTCPACTPLVLPVMLAAAASGSALMGGGLLFVFGVARGIPIVAAGAAADLMRRLFSTMFWMRRVERAAGVLFLLAAVAFAYQGGVWSGWFPPV